jgi:hypothetical protein
MDISNHLPKYKQRCFSWCSEEVMHINRCAIIIINEWNNTHYCYEKMIRCAIGFGSHSRHISFVLCFNVIIIFANLIEKIFIHFSYHVDMLNIYSSHFWNYLVWNEIEEMFYNFLINIIYNINFIIIFNFTFNISRYESSNNESILL